MQPTFYPAYWPDSNYPLEFHRLILTELAELADVVHLDFVAPDFGANDRDSSSGRTADWQAILDHPSMEAIRPRLILHLMTQSLANQAKLAIQAGIKHIILPTTDWSEFMAAQSACQEQQCYYMPSLEPAEVFSDQQVVALTGQSLMMGLNLMGVDSGATGQLQQTERLLTKIAAFQASQPNWLLAVDGGVRLNNVGSLWQAGVGLVFASQYGYWPKQPKDSTRLSGYELYLSLASDLVALKAQLEEDREVNRKRFASFTQISTDTHGDGDVS